MIIILGHLQKYFVFVANGEVQDRGKRNQN